jgi:2-iminobutanoate/2-iminopropanoate deaminase
MKKQIFTNDAPKPVGPYSQAILTGDTLYVSGQIAIDPQTNNFMNADIEVQTRMTIQNIKAVLASAGMEMKSIVKATIFLADMKDFGKVNEVYASFFSDNTPARECVQVARLPKDALVEISVIAVK